MKTYIQVDIYIRITPTQGACQRKKCKKKSENHHDSCIRVEDKSKRYALCRGKQRLSCDFKVGCTNLNAKERHFILPLVIWTFIMQSVAFIASISQDRIKLIFSRLINHTYLESKFYCIQQWQLTWRILINPQVGMVDSHGKTGFKGIWKHK